MYPGHVAVIMFNWCWTTGFDLVPMICEYMFAYAGGVKFLATCNSGPSQTITHRDFLKSVSVSQTGQRKALNNSCPSGDNQENKGNKPKRKWKRKSTSSDRKTSSKQRHSSRSITLSLPFKHCTRTRKWGQTSRTSPQASAKAGRLSLDKVLQKNRSGKHAAAPVKSELEEQDPIGGELSNPSD